MSKKMLINVLEPEEIRIAVLDDGRLEELYIERASQTPLVGNIYKARVINVEKSLNAAFVDFGGVRNGFLHFTDVAPQYHQKEKGTKKEKGELTRGQEVMVQVSREEMGKKAPRVTTYVSIPGRYLVLMPEVKHTGVSKKISDEQERQRLKKLLEEVTKGEKGAADKGVIVRTAGEGRGKRDLQRDLKYLLRLWRSVYNKFKNSKAPTALYQESDLVKRAVRDVFSTDIRQLMIDSEEEYKKVIEFMKIAMPRHIRAVKLYSDPEPLFHKFKLEEEIQKIYLREVKLPSGGSIVIDQTEAMVTIDVNSGKNVRETNIEETAYKTNIEAAKEAVRQIRLRDLGGMVLIDFIDMEEEDRRRKVEHALWNELRRDRARVKMLRMSKFGIVELTRQRMRESLHHAHHDRCPYCHGTGRIMTPESVSLAAFRSLRAHLQDKQVASVQVSLSPKVADYLQNEKRKALAQIEEESKVAIDIFAVPDISTETIEIAAYDKNGKKIKT